jgi:hypothetical protein
VNKLHKAFPSGWKIEGFQVETKTDVATKSVKNDSYEAFTCWCARLYDVLFFRYFCGEFWTNILHLL